MPLSNQNLSQGQSVTVTLAPVDINGNPSNPANGVPTWQSVDPSVTVAPAADGLSAVVTAGIKPGVMQINVTGQSIPFGPNFISSFTVTVAKGVAAAFLFSFSNLS